MKKQLTLVRSNPMEIYNLCMKAIHFCLPHIPNLKSLNSSYLRLVTSSFLQIYKLDISSKKSELYKLHQTLIISLLQLEGKLHSDYTLTLDQIKISYLNSGDNDFEVIDVLTARTSNIMIANLKLLIIQVMVKRFQASNYAYSDELLKFFLCDDYLDGQFLTNNQKNSLVKLTLALSKCSPSSGFAQAMNIKFLCYLDLFGLRFENYISNMKLEQFVKQVQSTIQTLTALDLVPNFIYNYEILNDHQYFLQTIRFLRPQIKSNKKYVSLNWDSIDPDSNSAQRLLKLLKMPNVNVSLILEELKPFGKLSKVLIEALCVYISPLLKSMATDLNFQNIIIIFVSQPTLLDNSMLKLFDSILLHASKFIKSPEFLDLALIKINGLFMKNNQHKRSRNVSNVFYNMALKVEGPFFKSGFLEKSLKIQKEVYLESKTEDDLNQLSLKFIRACKLSEVELLDIRDIVRLVLDENFLNLFEQQGLLSKIDLIEKRFGRKQSFGSSSIFNFKDYTEENRVLLFILLSKYSSTSQLSPLYQTLKIQQPINQMLCGIYFNDLPIVKNIQKAFGSLQQFEPLIKIFYYLTLEIKSKATSNLPKIVQMYIVNWIARNKGGCVSPFELDFLSKLVSYLRFVNYRKHLDILLKELKKYEAFGGSTNFKEWLIYHRIDNCLTLRMIVDDKHIVQILDSGLPIMDFETNVDELIRTLSFQLLRLRFHLINFNFDEISSCSFLIDKVIKKSLDPLSIKNTKGHNKARFVQVLSLLSNLYFYRSKALAVFGNQIECISSYSKCLKINKLILQLDPENLEALRLLSSSYTNLLQQLIQLGLSKDVDYFIGEFQKFNKSITKFKLLHIQNLLFLCYCYNMLGRDESMTDYKTAADAQYKSLSYMFSASGTTIIDNHKLCFYKLLSDVYCSATDETTMTAVKSQMIQFLEDHERDYSTISRLWRLKYELQYDCTNVQDHSRLSDNPYLSSIYNMLNAKRLLFQALSSLSIDPVFSTMEDSALSIPAANNLDLLGSPVASSAKAKNSQNIKRSIMLLKESKSLILGLFEKLKYLANYQINDIYKILYLDLLTLSSISDDYYNEFIDDCFKLSDYSKHQPFVNEKLILHHVRKSTEEAMVPSFDFDGLDSTKETNRYRTVNQDLLSYLPEDWLVISIDICSFNGDLIISKIDKDSSKPNALRLPLNRHSSRVYGEERFSLGDALMELKDIIAKSDATMSKDRLSNVTTPETRKEWHLERSELDERLKLLLEKIEFCWLGGFKGIFDQRKFSQNQIEDFRSRFLGIVKQNIPSRSSKPQGGSNSGGSNNTLVEIDDFVLELFLRLGDPSELTSVEVLEDLIYFLLDILLFHGEENAYDEIDIDNIYVEVETLLKEHQTSYRGSTVANKHTVLIVGKECRSIPWESLPCLRNSSTTRIPSLSILQHLLQQNAKLDIPKTNGTFILNPSGDLVKTQDRLEPIMEILTANNQWRGIINKKPTEDQVVDLITNSNLHVYIGHGGGESYIRSSTIKKLNQIAPTLLLGCSSALLQDNNLLEPHGTVYSYLIGGCPLVVGNLWDVTDKDIDTFSMSVFAKWGLLASKSKSLQFEYDNDTSVDICQAVMMSRDQCKLKYLNGAAPVVYGLPFNLA